MISIVIPTYNAAGFMPDLLDSIFRQKTENVEVIIVDDCSTDDTVKIAGNYPARVIELDTNAGPAKARNLGVKDSQGDVIFFLDADVIVVDGTIKAVWDFFEENPDSRCVIGICSTEPLNKGFVPRYMAMFEYIHLIGTRGNRVSVFAPRCGAIKKDFFEEIGGYNESYRGADVEDFELARRINRTDSILLNRKMMVKHRFADFRQATRNYFKRTVMWVNLFFREKKLDNAGPTAPSNGIAALCAFMSLISLLFIPLFPTLKYVFTSLVVIFLISNMRWWNFMRKEAGVVFAVKALFLNFFLGNIIVIAALYGVIIYLFGRSNTPVLNY